jgi:putative transcriptional regulator
VPDGGDILNLKTIRENAGLTQQELANLIKRDRTLIAKIENDNATPSVATAKALASVLNIDWTIFFKDSGEEASLNGLLKTMADKPKTTA